MIVHVASFRLLATIWAILLAFTLTTVLVARIELGPWNVVAALAIAVVKASLVAWFFMNVRHAKGMTRIFVVAGLLWLGILLFGTLTDYLSRPWLPEPSAWPR